MNAYNHICNEFSFLQEYGFVRKEYLDDGIEIVIESDKSRISILYYEGIDNLLDKKTCVDVIIEFDNKRQNLLCCDIFNVDEINLLKQSLKTYKPQKHIEILAHFLKSNIKSIV